MLSRTHRYLLPFIIPLFGCAHSIVSSAPENEYSPWRSCYQAAATGDIKTLDQDWLSKCDKATANGKVTLLMVAANHSQLQALDWLLAHGADLNQKTEIGDTALNFAAAANARLALMWLMAHGADPHSKRADGSSALMQVLNSHFTDTAMALINENFPVNEVNDQGWPPLFFAVRQMDLEVVKALIKHGAKLDFISVNQETAFTLAVEENWKEGSEYLLSVESAR